MENGDIGAINRVSSSRNTRPHDLDIKLLQAKRQQAEMRRCSRNLIFFLYIILLCDYKNKYKYILEINVKTIYEKIIPFLIHRCSSCPGKVNFARYANYSSTPDTTQD